jgi:MFS family permease
MSKEIHAKTSARERWGLIATYLILNIATGTVGGAMQVAVPLYALSLNADTAELGMIRGVSGIGILLLVIPAGFLVDHFGARRLFLIGGVFGTLATWSLSYASLPGTLVSIMGVAGLFAALKMTALNSSFYNNIEAIGIEKSGWFKGSMSIGLTFFGPLLGGYLAHLLGYRLLFKILAASTLIPISLVVFLRRSPKAVPHEEGLKGAIAKQLEGFRDLIGTKSLYLPLATEGLSTSFFATFSAFIALIAVQSMRLPETTVSQLMAIEGGLFIVTVFVAGPLIKLLSQFHLYLLSVSVVIAGTVILAFAGNYGALAAATVVLGFGLGLTNLVVASRIGSMKGEKGKIVGLFAGAVGVGISAGPMVAGFVGKWLGPRSIFLGYIPLFLGLLLAAYRQQASESREGAELGIQPKEIASLAEVK